MGRVTHGDVLAGLAPPEELVPFGGDRAYKAFALAVGLEMLVAALAGEEHGACCSSRGRSTTRYRRCEPWPGPSGCPGIVGSQV